MYGGEIVGSFAGAEATEEKVMAAAVGRQAAHGSKGGGQ